MPNRQVALRLAAAGIPVFPCQADKRPYPAVFWRRQSTTDPVAIERWWSRWPEALPGVDLAKIGILALDLDKPKAEGEADGIAWFDAEAGRHGYDPATHPVVTRTGSGGRHLFFRQPEGRPPLTNARGGLPPKKETGVDIRGHGGYVVAAGATLPDGRRYEGIGSLMDAPLLPEWLEAVLRGERLDGSEPETGPEAPPASASPITVSEASPGRVAAYAQAAIEDELRELRLAGRGGRNNQLNVAAMKLGQMVGAGWLADGEAVRLLESAATDCGLTKDDGIKSVRATIRSGMRKGRTEPRPALREEGASVNGAEAARRLVERDGHVIDAETGEVVDPSPARNPHDFPDDMLRVPGLVGDIAEWILETSIKPIRLFATAAALMTVATLVGRRVYSGVPRSGTHLYMLQIMGTGGGKDRPQEAIRQILDATVNVQGLHIGSVSSSAALSVGLVNHPVHVQIIDEISKVLSRLNGKHSSNQELALLQDYCTLWGRNLGSFMSEAVTTRSLVPVHRPWVSIFGATTFTAFYEQMRAKHVANGFLNRFLVLPRYQRVPTNRDVQPEDYVPDEIVDQCRALFGFQAEPPAHADARTYIPPVTFLQSPETPPGEPTIVEMHRKAEDIYLACQERDEAMLRAAEDDPVLETWSRAAEMTKRVALIVACGRHAANRLRGAFIDEGDMLFAKGLVDWSMETFVRGLRENMAENEHQANAKMVLGYIRKAGMIQRKRLYQMVDARMDSRALDAILNGLIEGGHVEVDSLEGSAKGGPKIKIYRHIEAS